MSRDPSHDGAMLASDLSVVFHLVAACLVSSPYLRPVTRLYNMHGDETWQWIERIADGVNIVYLTFTLELKLKYGSCHLSYHTFETLDV
jgi:alpha-mannosidase